MQSGFSSYLLVLRRNPFAKHIFAVHSARSAFIEAESNEKVRRALRTKLRTQSICLKQGDKVFQKRDDSNHRRGPRVSIVQDRRIALIRHVSIYIRDTTLRVLKFGEDITTAPDISNDDNFEKAKTLPKQKINQTDFFDDSDYDDCINNTETNKQNNNNQTVKNCPWKGDIIEYRLDN